MSVIEDRLRELGYEVPQVAAPVAAYVPALRRGNLVYTRGQLPFVDGTLPATGKVGAEVSPEARGGSRPPMCSQRARSGARRVGFA